MFSRAIRQSSRRVAAISASGRIASVSPSKVAAIAPALHLAIIYSIPESVLVPLALQLSFLDAVGAAATVDEELFLAEPSH